MVGYGVRARASGYHGRSKFRVKNKRKADKSYAENVSELAADSSRAISDIGISEGSGDKAVSEVTGRITCQIGFVSSNMLL